MNNPSFIIVGAMRSGTTSLYWNLCKHSQVKRANSKEIGYYWKYYHRGLEWYQRQFKSDCITGEATVHYMSCAKSALRIALDYPHVKIIALLRNPAERAYSHYCLMKRWERLPFESAITEEKSRLRNLSDETFEYQQQSYINKSLYHKHLKRYFDTFPRNNIHIFQSEKYFVNPAVITYQIWQLLGLDYEEIEYTKHSTLEYEPLRQETKERLTEYFKPYNEKLFELIGERFEW